ncbi:hypothetical protein E2C01_085727 [Portunus trituberculatus]|uniref:Uncharacterized protein n=1 Tax=Portunus trituberculatus TaxID=210409 RepID=A0A5B7IYW8_PORTR|nr:hypothetical protein [Portunus trituberculatus]
MWRESTSTHLNSDGARGRGSLGQAVKEQVAAGQGEPPAPQRLLLSVQVPCLNREHTSRHHGPPHVCRHAEELCSLPGEG